MLTRGRSVFVTALISFSGRSRRDDQMMNEKFLLGVFEVRILILFEEVVLQRRPVEQIVSLVAVFRKDLRF